MPPALVETGLTDLLKYGGPPCPPVPTALNFFHKHHSTLLQQPYTISLKVYFTAQCTNFPSITFNDFFVTYSALKGNCSGCYLIFQFCSCVPLNAFILTRSYFSYNQYVCNKYFAFVLIYFFFLLKDTLTYYGPRARD